MASLARLGGPPFSLVLSCLVVATGCKGEEPKRVGEVEVAACDTACPAPAEPEAGGAPTRVEIVGVDLRLFEDARVRVHRLVGVAISTRPGQPVALDDARSYVIEVESGETWIGYDDLAVVMNEHTFAFRGAPVGRLRMAREDDPDDPGKVELKGRLKRGLRLPFEIEGRPEATADGRIRIRTTSIQVLDIPVRGLLHALGLDAADLMGNMEERGLTFVGDDLILDASLALPPPRMKGRVTALRVEDEGMALTFGRPPASPPSRRSNYLFFRHGTIKIGRMTQTDAWLRITDRDPSDPFDFYGDRMNEQLAGAWSRMSEEGNLTMFVPDFDDIP